MGLHLGDEALPLPVRSRHLGPLGLYYNRLGWDLRIMFGLKEWILVSHRRRRPVDWHQRLLDLLSHPS